MNKKRWIPLAIISAALVIASIILLIPKFTHLNPQRVAVFEGFREEVGEVAFSKDGTFLARGYAQMITVTDTKSGKMVMVIPTGKERMIDTLTFSNNSKYLVSSKWEKISIWEMKTGKTIASLIGPPQIISISITDTYLAAGGHEGMITIWEVETWKKITQFQLDNYLSVLAFSQDGKFLALGCRDEGATIKILESGNWKELSALHPDFKSPYSSLSPSAASLSFSNDSRYLVAGDYYDKVEIWDTDNWKSVVIEPEPPRMPASHGSFSFSKDGKALAIGGLNKVRILEVGSWKKIASPIEYDPHNLKLCPSKVSFSEEEDKLLIYSCGIKVYKAGSWQEFASASLEVTGGSLTFMNGISRLAVGHDDGSITIWELTANQKGAMWIWKEITTLKAHTKEVFSLAATNDGKFLASSSRDEIKVWDTNTWTEVLALHSLRGQVGSVVFSKNGKLFGAAGGLHQIKIWETGSWEENKTIKYPVDVDLSFALSNDFKYLATVSTYGNPHVWETGSWKEMPPLRPRGFLDLFSFKECGASGETIALSQDGTMATVGYSDGCIKIWKIKGSKRIASFRGNTNSLYIKALTFSQDGKYLAFSGNNLEIWQLSK